VSKKILIATGGTGGHVYPAVALAEQLKQDPECDILFVGGSLATNRFFDRDNYSYHSTSCGSFANLSPYPLLVSLWKISKGVWESFKIIRKFKPDVIVGFGSYYAFPPLVAAKILSVPLVLHEGNSIPGKVNRFLSKWATVTGTHFPETIHLLDGKATEVGMPLRQSFMNSKLNSQQAKAHYHLDSDKFTLLIFGGSQGSSVVNLVVIDAINILKREGLSSFQVLHIAGDVESAKELKVRYENEGICAVVKSFEHNMEIALKAADLCISRSGAGTIAELLEFEVPSILIPYAKAADNHQEHNADFMVATVGGALKLTEKTLSALRFSECLKEFFKDDGSLLIAMKNSMQIYKKRARSRNLCSLVFEVVNG